MRKKSEALTVTVEHHQPRHHQDGVPVELQVRAIPGQTATPPDIPETHAGHAGHTQTDQQQVTHVEARGGPHLGETW